VKNSRPQAGAKEEVGMAINLDVTTQALSKLVDATVQRQRVLANNLANVDTPGFIRQDLPFEENLAEAMRRGDLSNFSPKITTDKTTPPRADGNNVQIERELAELNKNMLMHQMAIQIMQTKMTMQRSAVTGRSM
jgi:flagellar basal-body rod protein FlgB